MIYITLNFTRMGEGERRRAVAMAVGSLSHRLGAMEL